MSRYRYQSITLNERLKEPCDVVVIAFNEELDLLLNGRHSILGIL
jgi:hypothetical protein